MIIKDWQLEKSGVLIEKELPDRWFDYIIQTIEILQKADY